MRTINYEVHPTPLKPGETKQTYHVRQCMKRTMHTAELADLIAENALISRGVFLMVMERLKMELADQLMTGHDLHLDGIGRFALQLGTKKVKDESGRLVRKTYERPEDLTAHEVTVEGISFVPDKEMMKRLHRISIHFSHVKGGYEQEVERARMLDTLADYCREHGSFSRKTFQRLFGVSRYRAQLMLDELVNEPDAQICRKKFGSGYVYRFTN